MLSTIWFSRITPCRSVKLTSSLATLRCARARPPFHC
jgi:hypothetical protein